MYRMILTGVQSNKIVHFRYVFWLDLVAESRTRRVGKIYKRDARRVCAYVHHCAACDRAKSALLLTDHCMSASVWHLCCCSDLDDEVNSNVCTVGENIRGTILCMMVLCGVTRMKNRQEQADNFCRFHG